MPRRGELFLQFVFIFQISLFSLIKKSVLRINKCIAIKLEPIEIHSFNTCIFVIISDFKKSNISPVKKDIVNLITSLVLNLKQDIISKEERLVNMFLMSLYEYFEP